MVNLLSNLCADSSPLKNSRTSTTAARIQTELRTSEQRSSHIKFSYRLANEKSYSRLSFSTYFQFFKFN